MDELWGEARPVPEERLVVLGDGEEVGAAGGRLVAHDTPGHAYHHPAYPDPDPAPLLAGGAGPRLPRPGLPGARLGVTLRGGRGRHPAPWAVLRQAAYAAARDRRRGVGAEHREHPQDGSSHPPSTPLRLLRRRGPAPL